MSEQTDDGLVYATAGTDLMTLRMQVEYWRLEAQRLANLLAERDEQLARLTTEQAAK